MKILLALLAFVILSPVSAAAASHLWQESASGTIRLGVRDKFAGDHDSFTVTFRVTSETGKVYELVRKTSADEFLYVSFPSDFSDDGFYGRYTWQALVDSKPIAGGKFSTEY